MAAGYSEGDSQNPAATARRTALREQGASHCALPQDADAVVAVFDTATPETLEALEKVLKWCAAKLETSLLLLLGNARGGSGSPDASGLQDVAECLAEEAAHTDP